MPSIRPSIDPDVVGQNTDPIVAAARPTDTPRLLNNPSHCLRENGVSPGSKDLECQEVVTAANARSPISATETAEPMKAMGRHHAISKARSTVSDKSGVIVST